jgi:hypothetical protein
MENISGMSELKGPVQFEQELAGCVFRDVWLVKRFMKLLKRMWSGSSQSIPFVCQDWANTKAAYRFISNHRVSEENILHEHFQSQRTDLLKQLVLFWFYKTRQNFL